MNSQISKLGDVPPTELGDDKRPKRWILTVPRLAAAFIIILVTAGVIAEAHTAYLQAELFSRFSRALTFDVQPGPNPKIRFPKGGPYDERLGYSELPAYIDALQAKGFSITRQASWSPELKHFARRHGYAMYEDKAEAGLALAGRSGEWLYREGHPRWTYEHFQAIPALIVETLRFIEDRSLLDPGAPRKNPAVDWRRFGIAAAGQIGGMLVPSLKQGGASTLATQIEKFRHYPGGVTRTMSDKLNQMLAASTRSYLDGPETLAAQKRILVNYLNATPLSSRAGYGEVIGLAEGLWAWFGTDFAEANEVLASHADDVSSRKAELFKQVLSLLLAQRRPSYYLMTGRKELAAMTVTYLTLMEDAGIIGSALRNAAQQADLAFLETPPPPPPVSFVARKAATSIRTEMLQLLGTPSLYGLDRLDLTVHTTLDVPTQKAVAKALMGLGNSGEVKARGMVGRNLLGSQDASKVAYSVVLYERDGGRNLLRVRADSLNQPFDLNSRAKLILGSSAKLRTLLTYLDIIDRLHGRYESVPARELASESANARDPLTRWAAAYMSRAVDHSLESMLAAAMQRRYSANPRESFFTGGGAHVFGNYESKDNGKMPTVEEALVRSVNLAFIRIMRDIRDYYIAESGALQATSDANSQRGLRQSYLQRFADQEGSEYLGRFHQEFAGLSADEILSRLAGQSGRNAQRMAIVFRSVRPLASSAELHDFLARQLPDVRLGKDAVEKLYKNYGPDRFSLNDRAFLARVHPLQLWLAAYLQDHGKAARSVILAASAQQRQEAYDWLFKTSNTKSQDTRIRIIAEQDAFAEIHKDWRKQGYPFSQLVPSLATAIGSSGDRPDALAETMGIILNDGVRVPAIDIERMEFAKDTPYETHLERTLGSGERMFSVEVARTVRRALTEVVSEGTGTRFRGGFTGANGAPLIVGGKTGTGDNRIKTFGPGRVLMESRAVDRTATFVFFLGDRFYGTVTAHVPGEAADKYHFTSALAVQLLKSLSPELQPLINSPKGMVISGAPEDGRAIEM